jgi:hypothetical protein
VSYPKLLGSNGRKTQSVIRPSKIYTDQRKTKIKTKIKVTKSESRRDNIYDGDGMDRKSDLFRKYGGLGRGFVSKRELAY